MLTWRHLADLRWVAMLVVAVALFAVACGGGDDDTTTAAPAATAAATEAAPVAEAIQIGFSAWPGWFPWQVTVEAGIFDEVGVNVEMAWFEGDPTRSARSRAGSSTATRRR